MALISPRAFMANFPTAAAAIESVPQTHSVPGGLMNAGGTAAEGDAWDTGGGKGGRRVTTSRNETAALPPLTGCLQRCRSPLLCQCL